jgi:hypothetical protein
VGEYGNQVNKEININNIPKAISRYSLFLNAIDRLHEAADEGFQINYLNQYPKRVPFDIQIRKVWNHNYKLLHEPWSSSKRFKYTNLDHRIVRGEKMNLFDNLFLIIFEKRWKVSLCSLTREFGVTCEEDLFFSDVPFVIEKLVKLINDCKTEYYQRCIDSLKDDHLECNPVISIRISGILLNRISQSLFHSLLFQFLNITLKTRSTSSWK